MTLCTSAYLSTRRTSPLLLLSLALACGEGTTININCGPGTQPSEDGCVLADASSSGGSASEDEMIGGSSSGGTGEESSGGAGAGMKSSGGASGGTTGEDTGGTGADSGEAEGTGGAGGAPNVGACREIAIIGTDYIPATSTQFGDWIEAHSEAKVHYFDPRHPSDPQSQPTLTADFLNQFNVIVLRLQSDSQTGKFWTYSESEKSALEAWVKAGGALLSLSGYSGLQAVPETDAVNQLLSAVSQLSYEPIDILTGAESNAYCWGNSSSMLLLESSPLAAGVTAVGGFHGYPVTGGTAVAKDRADNVVGALEEVGNGIVLAWGDEGTAMPEQWWASDPDDPQYTDPNNPCYDKRPEQVFQHTKFWANVFSRLTADSECPITIQD